MSTIDVIDKKMKYARDCFLLWLVVRSIDGRKKLKRDIRYVAIRQNGGLRNALSNSK